MADQAPPLYAAARPLVNVVSPGENKENTIKLPSVFLTPIRLDIVRFVHTNMRKNDRQPYAVSSIAGHQTSARSWGTGRAVSRIPRVKGSGTSRSGQAAFGNMCRGGRMFAPTKIWRRWHRKINIKQKRFAVAAALAATAVTPLVQARGHRIQTVPEIPFVVSDESMHGVEKTKEAVALLKKLGAYRDVERVRRTVSIRSGKGKWRNRRYVQRKGPLIIHDNAPDGLKYAFRNIPGIDICDVSRLNLLQLAPGGHLGRFIIWTESAFKKIDQIYGSFQKPGKNGFNLPTSVISNADIARVINSDEVQSIVRPKIRTVVRRKKVNPLKSFNEMARLNPHYVALKRKRILAQLPANRKHTKELMRKKRRKNKRKNSVKTSKLELIIRGKL